MKIFYAVQATGNGHISRAKEILPYLQKYGTVDLFLSGSNSSLEIDATVKYRSKGLSLFYSGNGGLQYSKIARDIAPIRLCKEIMQLPVQNYDVVINDFESITSLACAYKKVPSIHFGHQASFSSIHTPRPDKQSRMGEFILKNYAKAPVNVGLHFSKYDEFILPPIIKNQIWHANPTNKGHITIYLLSYCDKTIAKYLAPLKQHRFEVFSNTVLTKTKVGNITFIPVSTEAFNQSLITCQGIITGAGFETPAEALYLQKKILAIPVKGQYEQLCNAAALQQLGVTVLLDIDKNFATHVANWVNNNTQQTVLFNQPTDIIIDNMM